MDISAILLVSLVVLLTGISKSAFAGALGVFAVPLLLLKFNAVEAIALMLPLLMMADAMAIRSFWNKWDKALLQSIIPGAILGIIVANVIIDFVNPTFLQLIVAFICIIFALKNLCFATIQLSWINNKTGAFVMSASSGITSTVVHAGAPPIILYLTSIGLAKTQFIATTAAFFALMNIAKLIGLISIGEMNIKLFLTALAFFPISFLGHWIGLKINSHLDKRRFLNSMNYLLFMLGGWLLISL